MAAEMKLAVYLLMPLFVTENGLVEIFVELHKIETVVLNCEISERKNRYLTEVIIVSFVELGFYLLQ